MKFRKIVPVLLSMAFCLSSAMLPVLPICAAVHSGNGTAGVRVTVTAADADDDGTGGRIPDDDGTGDKVPEGGGTGGQPPADSGGGDAEPGQDDGGSAADTDQDKDKNKDKDRDKEKDKDKDRDKEKDKDKDRDKEKDKDKNRDKEKNKDKDRDKDKVEGRDKDTDRNKGSDGTQKGEENKGAGDGNEDSGRDTGGRPGQKNPSGRPAILPVSGCPAGGTPDAYPEPGRGMDDGTGGSKKDSGDLKNTAGSTDEQEQGDADESGNADTQTDGPGSADDESGGDGDESDGAVDSGSGICGIIKMALRYWKQAVLALAVSVAAVFFAGRRIRFHGILTDKDIDGVLFHGNTDSADGAAVIPELIGKLNEGGISFEEYKDMVMESRGVTLLPSGTRMDISVTDAGMAKTWISKKADERRMYDRLGEAALLAQSKGRTIVADVVLKHDRKCIEIPLHFVFR